MSKVPECKHCKVKYKAGTEQQAGFGPDIRIRVWICSTCGHRKPYHTQEDFDAWDKAEKYVATFKKDNDFESTYKETNPFLGVPGIIKPQHDCNCDETKKDCGDCGGGCGSCKH